MQKIIIFFTFYSITLSSLYGFPKPWIAQSNPIAMIHASSSNFVTRAKHSILKYPKTSLLCSVATGYAAIELYNWTQENNLYSTRLHTWTHATIRNTWNAVIRWCTSQSLKEEIVGLRNELNGLTKKLNCYAHCDIMLERFNALEVEMKKERSDRQQEIERVRKDVEIYRATSDNTRCAFRKLKNELRSQF